MPNPSVTGSSLPVLDNPASTGFDSPGFGSTATSTATVWRIDPYLHIGPDRLYNPHTDLTLQQGEPGYARLRQLVESGAPVGTPEGELKTLADAGWLVPPGVNADLMFRIKFVSLEAHTVCNQACYFCPVSVAPREPYFMPMETYERIVGEVAALNEPVEAVFMISYNEPTADSRFLDQVRCLKNAGLNPATLTNGTGLTPKRIDELVELGGLRFLSINISTLDRDRYKNDRGRDHVTQVLRNLDYAKDRPVGEEMDIVVLGTGNEAHKSDFEAIRDRFAGSRFNTKYFEVNDRAGYLQIGHTGKDDQRQLCGCDHMGSRPIQQLHINPYGQLILCCQDYNETEIVGDLREQTLREALVGEGFVRARRRVYGLEQAPDNFICHNCRFALKR